MKFKILSLALAALFIAACSLPMFATPVAQSETPVVVATNTVDTRGVVTLNNVSFSIPLGVANDARSEMVSAITEADASPWGVAPAHLKFTLTGYQVAEKFHEPQIFVFPADEYAQVHTGAAQQIEKLKAVLGGSALTKDAMPLVPSFNATPILAAHMQPIDFQSGRGVRMLTQYAQYAAPVNNRELFYHFQGLTQDGKYYVIAILPVTSSILAEDEKPESAAPAGGVPFPPGTGPDPAYYESVTNALNAMYADSFNPSLFQLDTLIQSITITP